MADASTFEIGLGVGGAAAVDSAATSLQALADKLTAASAASDSASAAVTAGERAYAQAEGAADRAAKALERVGAAAEAQRGKLQAAMDAGDSSGAEKAAAKLQQLVARQSEAEAKAKSTAAAMQNEATALDRLKASAQAAADNESKLAKAQKEAESAAKKHDDEQKKLAADAGGSGINLRALSGALGKLGGPLGSAGSAVAGLGGAVQKMSKSLGALGPYVAVAVVAIAMAAGLAIATLAIIKFGIANADAARSAGLLTAGIAQSSAGGALLEDTIHSLQTKVPQTREELMSMAGELAKTGLRGKALSDALEDAAVKAAKLKYGPEFQKETLSLTSQAARLRDNISGPRGIFSGLNIEKLLGGLSKIVAMFDSTSVTGKAIKVVFESLFQPLVDGLAELAPKVVSFFIQFEIWSLKALIAIKPFGSTILTAGKIVGAVVLAVIAVFVGLAAILVTMSAVFGGVIIGLVYLSTILVGLVGDAISFGVALVSGPSTAVAWLKAKLQEAVNFIAAIDLGSIGKAMIDGLVNGITSSAGGVLDALKGAVTGAVDGAKKILGIASPAKVTHEMGLNTGEGMEGGIVAKTPDVRDAMEAMAAPPDAAAPATAAAPAKGASSASASKGSDGGNYAGATFNFYGVQGAEDALDRFLKLIEGDAAQIGGAVPA